MTFGELRFKRSMPSDQHTHLRPLEQRTFKRDSFQMSESLKGLSLPAEGRIEDMITKPLTAKAAAKKKKKKSEKKGSKDKSKMDAYRAVPESLTGREVSWSRSYPQSGDELPFSHDDLVRNTKSLQQHGHGPNRFDESQASALGQDIVLEDSNEVTVDNVQREKGAATIVLDPNGFPLDDSDTSLDLFDLKDQDERHSNSPRNFEASTTLARITHLESESHLLDSFAPLEKSLTLSHPQDSLTSMERQDSKTTAETYLSLSHIRDSCTSMHLQDSISTAEKSLALSDLGNSHPSNDKQNKLQKSTQSFGVENVSEKSGLDAKAAFNTASAFETFLRQQHGHLKTSLSGLINSSEPGYEESGLMNSSVPGYEEDTGDSSSDGDWDDPFRESKFWGSDYTLDLGDDDDVKSFREDSDAWASFGRIRRNETFIRRVSSKDMNCLTPSTPSASIRSPERSGEGGTLNHGNLTASQRSVRSLSALSSNERTVKQQLASLSLSQSACVAKLKSQWEEYDGGKTVFPDDLYLRFARCSPGNPFNVKSAWKVMKRVECRYFALEMSKMEKSVLSKVSMQCVKLCCFLSRVLLTMTIFRSY
jgi:hypothetical protein